MYGKMVLEKIVPRDEAPELVHLLRSTLILFLQSSTDISIS